MQLIPFQAVYPDVKLIASPEAFFSTVKNQFRDYVKSGFFQTSSDKSLYVYQIISPRGSYTGLITCTNIDDFITEKVLKHENTLAAKEQQMVHVVLQNKALVKPILLAYPSVIEIDTIIAETTKSEKPFFVVNFKETLEKHTIWAINDSKKIADLTFHFKHKVKNSYIADGHHRVATMISLYNTKNHIYEKQSLKNVLTVYIPFQDLQVYDYNRVLDIFNDISAIDFIVSLSKFCTIKKLDTRRKAKKKHEMTFLIADQWYSVKWKKKILNKYKKQNTLLDVALLNKYVLKGICNMTNIREDDRIKYINGVSGLSSIEKEVSKSDTKLGICLYPITKSELITIADNKKTLPPKSTWFEPRIKNGMIVNNL